MSYGRMSEAEARLAAEVAGWLKEAEAADKAEDGQRGDRPRQPNGIAPERAQRNFTDPDSRLQPTREGFIAGYNG